MGAGALLQIASAGRNTDAFLTSNPSFFPWRVSYRRQAAFSLETFRMDFDTKVGFSDALPGTYRLRIVRHADVLLSMTLVVRIPDVYSSLIQRFRWVPWLGLYLMERATLSADAQIIDTFHPDFAHFEAALRDPLRAATLDSLVGNVPAIYDPRAPRPVVSIVNNLTNYTYYPDALMTGGPSVRGRDLVIPMSFFLARGGTRTALPLVSLQLSEMILEIQLRPLNALFQVWDGGVGDFRAPGPTTTMKDFVAPGETYPLEIDARVYGQYAYVDVQERRRMITASRTDYLVDVVHQETVAGVNGSGTYTVRLPYTAKCLVWCFRRSDASVTNVLSDFSREPSWRVRAGAPEEPMRSCALMFNSAMREEEKPFWFYKSLQPFSHTAGGALPPGVYMYSFALDPFAEEPSGSADLSQISRIQMRVELDMPDDPGVSYELVCYSLSTNIFRVQAGQGSLVFV